MVCLKEKNAKKNKMQKESKHFIYDCKHVFYYLDVKFKALEMKVYVKILLGLI